MNNILKWLSNNPYFLVISGFASIISLVIAIINKEFILWIILTINLFMLSLLFIISYQNYHIIGQLDVINLHVFDSTIDLDADEDGNYSSHADLIVAIQAILSSNTYNTQPKACLQIQYPSQIKIRFFWREQHLIKEEETIDSCKIILPLRSGTTFVAIRNIGLNQEDEPKFQRSSKKIIINLTCTALNETKQEIVSLSTVG